MQDRGGSSRRAHPAHVFSQQAPSGIVKFSRLELLHAKRFNHAITAGGLLNNLAQLAQAVLAVFSRTSNFSAKFSHRPNHKRPHHTSPPPPSPAAPHPFLPQPSQSAPTFNKFRYN